MTARRRRATTTPAELDGLLAKVDSRLVQVRDRLRAGDHLSLGGDELTLGDVTGGELLRDIDRVFAVGRARALARTLGVGIVFTIGVRRARSFAHVIGLDRIRDLARALDHDRARGLARALARDLARVRTDGRPRAREELARRVEQAHRRVVELRALLFFKPAATGRMRGREGLMVSGTAVRLMTWAVRALPEKNHARYAEEFQRELWELAATGAGRGQQFRYAVRQLIHTPRTRRALRSSSAGRRVVP